MNYIVEELRELYQQVILDHNAAPRNFRALETATHHAEGDNPLCGDHVDLYLIVEGDRIKDISFQGKGCAISKASASVMTSALKGKTVEEAKALFEEFHDLVTKDDYQPDLAKLGKLAVFAGVRAFPVRVKCASLAWHTLLQALKTGKEVASTE
jgi:nitrogen fixation NifU-like protein